MRLTSLALALLALLLGPAAGAQPGGDTPPVPGTWRAYPALRSVTALDATPDAVWTARTIVETV